MTTDLTTIEPPNGDQAVISQTRRMIADARIAKVAEIEATTAALTVDNYKAETKGKFKSEKDTAKNAVDMFLKKVLAESGADAVTVELAAYQTAIAKAVKAYEAKWDTLKSYNTLPLPTHTYLVRFTGTDAVLADLVEYAKKKGAAEFVWCVPQTDKAVKAAQRIFKENV